MLRMVAWTELDPQADMIVLGSNVMSFVCNTQTAVQRFTLR